MWRATEVGRRWPLRPPYLCRHRLFRPQFPSSPSAYLTLHRLNPQQHRCFTDPPNRALVDAIRELTTSVSTVHTKDVVYKQVFDGKRAQALAILFNVDVQEKIVRDKIAGPLSVVQTFNELFTIQEADEARAKSFWTAPEHEVFKWWLTVEFNNHEKQRRAKINMKYLSYEVMALAGYGAWHLVFGSSWNYNTQLVLTLQLLFQKPRKSSDYTPFTSSFLRRRNSAYCWPSPSYTTSQIRQLRSIRPCCNFPHRLIQLDWMVRYCVRTWVFDRLSFFILTSPISPSKNEEYVANKSKAYR